MYTAQKTKEGYELFITVEAQTADGEKVSVLQSVGVYTLEGLEGSITEYENQVADLQARKEAIEAL